MKKLYLSKKIIQSAIILSIILLQFPYAYTANKYNKINAESIDELYEDHDENDDHDHKHEQDIVDGVSNIPDGIGSSADQEKLEEIQRKLEEIRKQKSSIEQTINSQKGKQGSYYQEIAIISQEKSLLEAEISEKQLTIEELTTQIDILNKNISDTLKVIEKTQVEIDELDIEANKQLSDMYLDIKTYNTGLNLIFSEVGTKNFVKNGLYQKSIQEDTNNSLRQLQEKSDKLEKDRVQMEEDKEQVSSDKDKIEDEKKEIDSKKGELDVKIARVRLLIGESQQAIDQTELVKNGLSASEQQLLAEAELLKQRISNSVSKITSGSKVLKGTIIGYEGKTGVATGNHLHFGVVYNGSWQNPCSYLPSKQLANASCGVSNPKIPEWPMKGSPYLTSGFRTPSRPTHDAIDIASGGSAPIYAAHDGYIVYGNDGACSWYNGIYPCNGAGANYAIICENKDNCNIGLKTNYWHLK